MQWNSLSEFLAMGGYALYVWGSFGATALVMLCESLLIRSQPVIGALFRSFSMLGKRLPAEQKQALKEQLAAIPGL